MIETIPLAEFHRRLKEQGVPREHCAVKCPICGTVQSLESLYRAGVAREEAEKYIAFSCVGRFTNAGPHKRKAPPGRGCDWTLGGLFRPHKLIVVCDDGKELVSFEVATPAEAVILRAQMEKAAADAVVPAETGAAVAPPAAEANA